MRKQSWSSCFLHLLPFVSMLDTGCCSPCSACHTVRQFNDDFHNSLFRCQSAVLRAEPVFLNVSGAQESTPKNEFRQPILAGGYDIYIPTRFLAPIDCLKIPAQNRADQRKYRSYFFGDGWLIYIFFSGCFTKGWRAHHAGDQSSIPRHIIIVIFLKDERKQRGAQRLVLNVHEPKIRSTAKTHW
jgi:hypothetical protein